MKKTSGIIVVCLLALLCSNPESHRKDYTLSPGDKEEITNMASLIRDVPVDSITVGPLWPCYHVAGPLSYPYGVVYFKPEPIDSDKIVFSRLAFCHVDWPAYSSFFVNDSNPIVLNGWATSPQHLYCDTALVVHFDSCSLSVLYWNYPRKDTMSYYLNKIYIHDYMPDSGRGDMPSLCSDAGHTLHYWQYSQSDSTFIHLYFAPAFPVSCYSSPIYCFVEFNGDLSFTGIAPIVIP